MVQRLCETTCEELKSTLLKLQMIFLLIRETRYKTMLLLQLSFTGRWRANELHECELFYAFFYYYYSGRCYFSGFFFPFFFHSLFFPTCVCVLAFSKTYYFHIIHVVRSGTFRKEIHCTLRLAITWQKLVKLCYIHGNFFSYHVCQASI